MYPSKPFVFIFLDASFPHLIIVFKFLEVVLFPLDHNDKPRLQTRCHPLKILEVLFNKESYISPSTKVRKYHSTQQH